jgi:hypothetical protein
MKAKYGYMGAMLKERQYGIVSFSKIVHLSRF